MTYKFDFDKFHWNPNCISQADNSALVEQNYALIILNHGLDDLDEKELNHFDNLWNSAKFRLSVDGGTNKLLDISKFYIPHCISGDFDSITESTLNHFKKMKVRIVETPDQDFTDFMKALTLLKETMESQQLAIDHIIVICQVNYRLDQIFSNIATLHKWYQMVKNCPIFLLDLKGSLSWLLSKADHEIISNKVSTWCSLVPFDGSSCITSTGLMYNMDKLILSFNVILSTSNRFDPSMDKVTLQVHDKPVLWSQEFIIQ